VCVYKYVSSYESAKKLVKRALNLQDLLCLAIFIYIIYLLAILLRCRLLGLKSIYLLREHHTKSIAERSYSLLRGSDFSLQTSLPRAIPINCPGVISARLGKSFIAGSSAAFLQVSIRAIHPCVNQ
jgi:hypothetical protein